MNITVINWPAVNNVVTKTLEVLGDSPEVRSFLDWYEQMANRDVDIYDPAMVRWIIAGIPLVRTIVEKLNRSIRYFDQRSMKILTSSGPGTTQEKIKAASVDDTTVKDLRGLVVDFLGCRNELGDWYVNLLRRLSARFPQVAVFRNTIPYFEQICLENRQALLSR